MATFPDTYTKGQLKSDLAALARRENDTLFTAQLERFIWQARAHLSREFALRGVADFEADFSVELAVDDTSVPEPVGFARWISLWLEDTDGAFVSNMSAISYPDYQLLLSGDDFSGTAGGIYLLDEVTVDGAPRVYARWNKNLYLFPAVDTEDLVLRGAYYSIPSANLAAEDDTFGTGDPLFGMQDILYEAAAWRAEEWLKDPEAANRHFVNMSRGVSTQIKLLRMERDVPEGEYSTDSVEG